VYTTNSFAVYTVFLVHQAAMRVDHLMLPVCLLKPQEAGTGSYMRCSAHVSGASQDELLTYAQLILHSSDEKEPAHVLPTAIMRLACMPHSGFGTISKASHVQ